MAPVFEIRLFALSVAFVERACSRLSIVRFATGPKRSMGHVLGAEKIDFFNSRYIDDDTRAGASVESCQSVALRSPWDRLGSVLDLCNRLRRMRGRFDRWIHISTGPQLYNWVP